ncbi:MAG: hypothetical protein ACI9K2_005115, partial [Myxococcota bacterium]
RAGTVLAKRQVTLDAAYAKKPERFPNGPPKVQQLPKAVHINPTVPALVIQDGTPQAEEVRASPSAESRSG